MEMRTMPMPQETPQSDAPGPETRPAPPEALREEAHPRTPAGESKQPYATELNDYHGVKSNPPKEAPTP